MAPGSFSSAVKGDCTTSSGKTWPNFNKSPQCLPETEYLGFYSIKRKSWKGRRKEIHHRVVGSFFLLCLVDPPGEIIELRKHWRNRDIKFSPIDPALLTPPQLQDLHINQELKSMLHFNPAEHFPTAQLWWFNLSFCLASKKWPKAVKLNQRCKPDPLRLYYNVAPPSGYREILSGYLTF